MIKTLIVDDETPARSRLRKLLSDLSDVEIIGEGRNGVEAVELIFNHRPDLVFLDIQMPGINGFEVIEAIKTEGISPLIIFATAYDDYALPAFNARAIDYLLKPLTKERLLKAIERARLLCGDTQLKEAQRKNIFATARELSPSLTQIVARKHDRYMLLQLSDVLYFQADQKSIKVITSTGSYGVHYQLSELEESLPSTTFFRARRSIIVNLQHVKEIVPFFKSTYLLILGNSDEIAVSERQSKRLREILKI